jgi:ribonuclease HIII
MKRAGNTNGYQNTGNRCRGSGGPVLRSFPRVKKQGCPDVTDDKLVEYCKGIRGILVANNVTPGPCKSIPFGMQFPISREEKSGTLRIYLRRDGTFTRDYSPLKDPEFRESIREVLEKKPAAVPPVKTSRTADTRYDVGYPVIGTDESGKGDYFGPLVCAAVCVDEADAGTLRSIGVRDSKTCTDEEIRQLAEKIRELCDGKFEIIEISPERYNTLYGELSREGKNLNTMLAWGHARAIEELLKKVDCTVAIADQFGDERYILGKLQARGRSIRLIQTPRAEANIAVAAASVLARDRFLEKMAAMGKRYRMTFPRGASAAVIKAAQDFAKKNGAAKLPSVAKMHFKTTAEVQEK